jgi:hypothetical protein
VQLCHSVRSLASYDAQQTELGQWACINIQVGMAKAVADSTQDNQGGYASDGIAISGFSHMHDSGTGGASSLYVHLLTRAYFGFV